MFPWFKEDLHHPGICKISMMESKELVHTYTQIQNLFKYLLHIIAETIAHNNLKKDNGKKKV